MPTLSMKDFEHAYDSWHINKTSDAGYITELFRRMKGVYRSDHATHSVAAIGKLAKELTKGHTAFGTRYGIFGDYPFSHSSPWQYIPIGKYYSNNYSGKDDDDVK